MPNEDLAIDDMSLNLTSHFPLSEVIMTEDTASSPAKNIDILSYRSCDQACRHCSYVESERSQERPHSSDAEVDFIHLLRSNYPNSTFFLYPRDIVTATPLIPVMKEINQSETLTNGNRLDVALVDRLLESGIKRIQITLFGTAAEQQRYNRNSPEEFERIKANIQLCIERGLRVQVNNVLSRETMESMELLGNECVRLGVRRLRFIRLQPVGDAINSFESNVYLTQSDLEDFIIPTVERLKQKFRRQLSLYFAVNFGPNFYGMTPEKAREMLRKRSPQSSSDTFCPAIDGQYWNISTKSGNVHWCFNNLAEGNTRIGKVDWETGLVTLDRPVDLSRETLHKKLRGICAAEACPYQEACLGGCRSAAISFASDDTWEDRFYAGMDMCLTPAYSRYHNKST
ncbi:radical SAM protein [Pseudanabaena sp. 'Roaring Creek']|uniref:radical SAM protein n=1 Tax=Pseudanabaena sp. 'Roaring Creek' TaxID=1681830 RepID=UPI000B1C36AD|nr:radical SAM protein [Pseudanabaena sp. 'Roaring Creek']